MTSNINDLITKLHGKIDPIVKASAYVSDFQIVDLKTILRNLLYIKPAILPFRTFSNYNHLVDRLKRAVHNQNTIGVYLRVDCLKATSNHYDYYYACMLDRNSLSFVCKNQIAPDANARNISIIACQELDTIIDILMSNSPNLANGSIFDFTDCVQDFACDFVNAAITSPQPRETASTNNKLVTDTFTVSLPISKESDKEKYLKAINKVKREIFKN